MPEQLMIKAQQIAFMAAGLSPSVVEEALADAASFLHEDDGYKVVKGTGQIRNPLFETPMALFYGVVYRPDDRRKGSELLEEMRAEQRTG